MRAGILTIGDEVMRGEILDANAQFFAERLTELGLEVRAQESSSDELADIQAALLGAAEKLDLVIVSGGLGPTEDDRTVDAIAGLLGVPTRDDPEALAGLRARYERSGIELTANNLRQVRVVQGAEVLANRIGIAPGFRVRVRQAELFVLPGVPREAECIFAEQVAPILDRLPRDRAMASRTLHVYGLPESHVDHRLAGLADAEQGVSVHYRLAAPEIRVRLSVRHANAEGAQARLRVLETEARSRLGVHVYGVDGDSFPAALGRRLREKAASLALAESCTGGRMAGLVTSVPGSSDYFRMGLVTYSNESKQKLLGVEEATLGRDGAVSQACALEMAEGIRRLGDATVGLGVTGIAGPGGGTAEKPVGTVFFALAGPLGTRVRQMEFQGDRKQVQARAAHHGLALIYGYWDET